MISTKKKIISSDINRRVSIPASILTMAAPEMFKSVVIETAIIFMLIFVFLKILSSFYVFGI